MKKSSEQFADHIRDHIKAHTDLAWFKGWDKGFTDGWNRASEHFRREAEKQRAALAENPRPPIGYLDRSPTAPASLGTSPMTANDIVYRFIKNNPGKRGVEIATTLGSDSPPMHERTVRTALHRLRHKFSKIRIVDGRWYAAEAAPADPQHSLIEEDNDATP